MWPYWLMLLVPAFAAIVARAPAGPRPSAVAARQARVAWIVSCGVLALLIGLRLEVGGDWLSYMTYADRISELAFAEVLLTPDPGYAFVNWLAGRLGWGVAGANLICGAIFATGLAYFCRHLHRPWLALAVAVPYMVIVVSMGYSRQGVALAFAMIGLVALGRRSTAWFAIYIIVAALFHKTAVLLLPIAALAATRNKYWTIAWISLVTALAYLLFLADSAEALYENYVEAAYESEGALVRLLMNAVPAIILLLFWRRFRFGPSEGRLWLWFAVISIVLLLVLYAIPGSTAVDRIALYMLPLQLVVFTHLPDVFGKSGRRNQVWVTLVVLYYCIVQFVWLNFATHAEYWIPYRSYLAEARL